MPSSSAYHDLVFLNCPFDDPYTALFQAAIFAIHDAGFVARCALEIGDSAENRLAKIIALIGECKYGVHDISRTSVDQASGLPRFNMPLELGIFLGCRAFGARLHRLKACLVFDSEPYRYQRFLSDIAGQDILAHHEDPKTLISQLRNWLRTVSKRTAIPGGAMIWSRFAQFQQDLPAICQRLHIGASELTFVDYRDIIATWLQENMLARR